MSLPKIDQPIFQIIIPSTQQKLSFRAYLVKEEKILLMAKQGNSEVEILQAIKQVIHNCCLEKKFNIHELTLFDLEYVFIQLRIRSVNSVVEVTYIDDNDGKPYNFKIDLNQVVVKYPDPIIDPNIKINDHLGIVMKYPRASLYSDKAFLESKDDSLFQLLIRCVEKIYDAETVYPASNYQFKEIGDFLESLDITAFENIKKFISSQPTIFFELKYKNSLDMDKSISLTTLSDFFSLY